MPAGVNLYAYVGGNPVSHIDPLGLFDPRPLTIAERIAMGEEVAGGESWTHSLRQRDKWQLRSLQARISLERKESHDEEIPPQSVCGI